MAEYPGITRDQALRIYHARRGVTYGTSAPIPQPKPTRIPKMGRDPNKPRPPPIAPKRPVGMQEGGFLGPGDPGFDPMGTFEAPSEESIAAAELAARRAELERLGTIGMDTDGDGIISKAERNAAIGAGPPVITTDGTSGSPGPGNEVRAVPGDPGFDPMAGFPTEEEIRAAEEERLKRLEETTTPEKTPTSTDTTPGTTGTQNTGIAQILALLQQLQAARQQTQTNPFATQQSYNPYQRYQNLMMPQMPQFGRPYMSQTPFLPYAGMANPMSPSIFGGYGYGYGPRQSMAPLSYYGGFSSIPTRPPTNAYRGNNWRPQVPQMPWNPYGVFRMMP